MNYYDFGTFLVARNPNCGSRSIALGMNDAFGLNLSDCMMKFAVPQVSKADHPVKMLFREPVERFLSATAVLNYPNLQAAIGDIENGDEHFGKQSDFITGDTKIFKFPERYEEFCKEIQIPIYHVGQSYEKFIPTRKQREFLENYYASDYAIWEAL